MAAAHVNSVQASSTNSNTITSAATDMTGSNFLSMVQAVYSAATDGTPSDSEANSWVNSTTQVGSVVNRCRIGHVVNPTVGASQTFTLTGTAIYPALVASGWSGMDTSAPFDQQAGSAVGTGTTTIECGSATPSEDNELMIAGEAFDTGNAASSVDSSYTLGLGGNVTANTEGVQLAYQIQTTATARNPILTHAGNAGRAGKHCTFKSAAAGGAARIGASNMQFPVFSRLSRAG